MFDQGPYSETKYTLVCSDELNVDHSAPNCLPERTNFVPGPS
jgi:hypothetical protein